MAASAGLLFYLFWFNEVQAFIQESALSSSGSRLTWLEQMGKAWLGGKMLPKSAISYNPASLKSTCKISFFSSGAENYFFSYFFYSPFWSLHLASSFYSNFLMPLLNLPSFILKLLPLVLSQHSLKKSPIAILPVASPVHISQSLHFEAIVQHTGQKQTPYICLEMQWNKSMFAVHLVQQ